MDTIDKFINNRSPKKIVVVFVAMLIFSAVLSAFLSDKIADTAANEQLEMYMMLSDGRNLNKYGISADMPLQLLPIWHKIYSISFLIIFSVMGLCSLIWMIFSMHEFFEVYDSLENISRDCIKSADNLKHSINLQGSDGECIRRISESAELLANRMTYLNNCLEHEKNYLRGFLNDFSHQIKTALAVIQLNIDMLEGDITSEKREELVDEIQLNICGIEEIVIKAMKLARLETNTVEYNMKNICFAETCEMAVKRIFPVLRDKNINIICNFPKNIVLNHDKGWICEAVENVLKNSADHSECTEICLEIEENTAMIKLSLTDNGIGIPKKDIQHLFEPFAKKSADITMKSAGLGMSIAQKIVRNHGGEIIVYSKVNEGTRFEFVFIKS